MRWSESESAAGRYSALTESLTYNGRGAENCLHAAAHPLEDMVRWAGRVRRIPLSVAPIHVRKTDGNGWFFGNS